MITEYELYSDERKEKYNGNSYLTIGGLVCTDKGRDRLLAGLKDLRSVLTGEVGWKNASAFYVDSYKAWLDVFFDDPHARYSVLSVNQTSHDWQIFRRQLNRRNSHDDPLASVYYQSKRKDCASPRGQLRIFNIWQFIPQFAVIQADIIARRGSFQRFSWPLREHTGSCGLDQLDPLVPESLFDPH